MSRHSAYERINQALKCLLIGRGKDSEKIDNARLFLSPLLESDFKTEEEKNKYNQVMELYRKYKPIWCLANKSDERETLYSASWQIRKRFKQNLLDLHTLITDN